MDVYKTLVVVIYIYSTCSWLQQNGELTFDISLETNYDNISLKAGEYPDIRSLNYANIPIPKTTIRCSPNKNYKHVHDYNKTIYTPGREISLQHLVSNSVTSAHHSITRMHCHVKIWCSLS